MPQEEGSSVEKLRKKSSNIDSLREEQLREKPQKSIPKTSSVKFESSGSAASQGTPRVKNRFAKIVSQEPRCKQLGGHDGPSVASESLPRSSSKVSRRAAALKASRRAALKASRRAALKVSRRAALKVSRRATSEVSRIASQATARRTRWFLRSLRACQECFARIASQAVWKLQDE